MVDLLEAAMEWRQMQESQLTLHARGLGVMEGAERKMFSPSLGLSPSTPSHDPPLLTNQWIDAGARKFGCVHSA